MFSPKYCILLTALAVFSVESAGPRSVCNLPKPEVSCRTSVIRRQWFYEAHQNRCRPFITCPGALLGGGVNSFDSLAECLAACIDASDTEHSIGSRSQRRSSAVVNSTVCPELRSIRNGSLVVVNNTVTYTCREGFVLVGGPARRCLDNGTWDSDEPRCNPVATTAAVRCPTPQAIDYMSGASVSCFNPGCTINYTCQESYTLVGDGGKVCDSSGAWVGTPVCAKLVLLYNQTTYNDQQLELPNGLTKVHIHCVMQPRFFPAGVQPRWSKRPDGALGEGSRDYWGRDFASYWLYFDKLLPEEHSGTYTCSVGRLEASFKLKVLPPTLAPPIGVPTLVRDIDSLSKQSGRLAQFTCIMKGQPVPQLSWSHNGRPIVNNPPNVTLIQYSSADTNMATIIIPAVSRTDAGTYLCTGNNSAGTTQASATLTVTGDTKRSVSISSSAEDGARGVEHLCSNRKTRYTVTVVGRVRQHTPTTTSGLDGYQVQISSVLGGTADEGAVVTVIAATLPLPRLRAGSRYVFQGTLFGSKLYVPSSDSIQLHSRQLETFLQSC